MPKNPDIKLEAVPLADLKHPERNVRIHGDVQIRELQRSLERFGQTRPAVIDEGNVILVGNGMVTAMRNLGWPTVACLRRTDLNETDKLKLMLADNRIYALGHDDRVVIQSLLTELEDMDVPGYDASVLEALAVNIDDMEKTIKGYGALDQGEIDKVTAMGPPREQHNIMCPKCGESIWVQ